MSHPVGPATSPLSFVTTAEGRCRQLENQVVSLVNQVRRRADLPELRHDERLRASARAYSTDMARRGFFSHVDPDGGTPVERMRAAGYPQPAAENLAVSGPVAAEAVRMWMNSPGHRRNILLPDVAAIGVGVFLRDRQAWWTQHFGY